ncbi:MAG: NUDIX domain-containing protein [Candidatus Izemoplasma sp.]
MELELFYDGITEEEINKENTRIACRGIVKRDGLFLMVHLKKYDIYTFPGGGLEPLETLSECTVRELLEETGIKVKVLEEKVTIKEFFLDSTWENHYHICEYIEDTNSVNLTEEETDLGLEVKWMKLDDILEIFEESLTLHENGPTIHNREFLGLMNSL